MNIKGLSLGLLASLFVPVSLNAGGGGPTTWCIEFVNFCDSLLLTVDINTSEVTGTWDWQCGGSVPVVAGAVQPGNAQVRVNCETSECAGNRYQFVLQGASKTFDLYLDDGAGNPIRIQNDQPYRQRGAAACPAGENAGGEASWGTLN